MNTKECNLNNVIVRHWCVYLHFCGLMRWASSANLHKAALRLREAPFYRDTQTLSTKADITIFTIILLHYIHQVFPFSDFT